MRQLTWKICFLMIAISSYGVADVNAQGCSSCETSQPAFAGQTGIITPDVGTGSYDMGCNSCGDTSAYTPVVAPSCDTGSPHCYKGIGGGRSIFKAMIDENYTRTVSVYAGFSSLNDKASDVFNGSVETDDAGLFGFEIGRRHSPYMRSAFDFSFRSGDITDLGVDPTLSTSNGDVEVFSLMKNFYLDFAKPCKKLTPYAGFGLGVAITDFDGAYLGAPATISDEAEFAYQLMAGLDYKIRPQAALFAEYRFFGTGDDMPLESAGAEVGRGSYSSHDVIFGLRFGY